MTILRNPLEAFESYYSYMNIDSKLNMDINEFAMVLAIRNVRNQEFLIYSANILLSIPRMEKWRMM